MKTKKKNSVFQSLDGSVKGFKFEKSEDKKLVRIKRRFTALKNRIAEGKILKLKHIRRYIKWATELGEEIPKDISSISTEMEAKSYKSKNKPQSKRKRKPKKYDSYIKSKLWENVRNKYYGKHGRWCRICKSTKFIHLHHKYYGNYGDEKDEDLIPLCNTHHDEVHKFIGKTKKNMRKLTDDFIKNYATIINL